MVSGIIWTILGIAMIIAETFTSGFILLWFGVGALLAALLAFVGLDSFAVQLAVFLGVSVILTVASRTIFEEFFMRHSPGKDIKTGVDALPGQVAVVVTPSKGALQEGAVQVFGSVWKARPAEGEDPLAEGESVQVERVQGLTVYVRRTAATLPWRESTLSRDIEQKKGA
ncbi:MAG TPA: NfeD family protein [Blastocatellia bacterium]|nr:NfeD family protein [Blastocatellia bacterium]